MAGFRCAFSGKRFGLLEVRQGNLSVFGLLASLPRLFPLRPVDLRCVQLSCHGASCRISATTSASACRILAQWLAGLSIQVALAPGIRRQAWIVSSDLAWRGRGRMKKARTRSCDLRPTARLPRLRLGKGLGVTRILQLAQYLLRASR